MVKGMGTFLTTGVESGLDFAVVGEAAFLQLRKNQFAIEADLKPPSIGGH